MALERTGGFGNIHLSEELDSKSLDPDKAQQLHQIVEQADFFRQPSKPQTPPKRGAADYYSYRITVEQEDGQKHVVETNDLSMSKELRTLVDFVTREVRKAKS